ncbi:hypothetical protein L1987_80369 [Smallanthus sonchifolius]|uniref:Uncharacterized protein n=1 Tax=Smallanthus sonchifolius TaxID=185202 RepID=A0ACB8YN50_9ASTR|nr:hypothetical protein L1987_80369 [Smallanthus sonchifolius]
MDGPSPTTPSSHASVNPTNTNTMSSDASNCSNRYMAWEWGECRDAMKKQCVWCKICGHKMSGGITRLKQHLTHTGGQVKGCPKVTVDIQKRFMASIKEKQKIQLEKKRNMQILSSHSADLSDEDEEDQDDQTTFDRNNPIKEMLKMEAWDKFAIGLIRLVYPSISYVTKVFKIRSMPLENMEEVFKSGYYLNPAIFHGENSKEIKKNRNIVTGLYVAIDRLVPDDDENDKVRQDLNLYIDSVGQFGSATAIRGRKKVAPCK